MTSSDLLHLSDAFGATLLFVVETTLRLGCVLLHILRWIASESGVECVIITDRRCDDFDRELLYRLNNETFIDHADETPSWACFIKSSNESAICRIDAAKERSNGSFTSSFEHLIPIGNLSPSAFFFYQEFGFLIFVLNGAFLLFSGIVFALAEATKTSAEVGLDGVDRESDKENAPIRKRKSSEENGDDDKLALDRRVNRIPFLFNLLLYSYRIYRHFCWLTLAFRCACLKDQTQRPTRNARGKGTRHEGENEARAGPRTGNDAGNETRTGAGTGLGNDIGNGTGSGNDAGGNDRHPLRLRRDVSREGAKCFGILEVVFSCMYFTSVNLYVVLLNLNDVGLLEPASLSATVALMFYQTSVQGYFRSKVGREEAKAMVYGFMKLCLHVLIVGFAVYFSSEISDPFARKYFNPYLLTLIHAYLYLSLKG